MENLAQLEALCEKLYNSQDSAERAYAENTLRCFSQDTNCIPQCEYILENSRSAYPILMASSSLMKHVTDNNLPLQLRLQIRNRIINFLAARGAEMEPFVISSLIQLLCRLTKISWSDDTIFQELVKDCLTFLNQETQHYAIGLKILTQLVGEMNQTTPEFSLIQHRKIATMFRDKALLQIYEISLTSLLGLKNDARHKLQEYALSLSLQCLSFDFVGILPDESSDEVGTIQVPSSWRTLLEQPATLCIYFEYYAVTSPPLSKLALENLVRLASVRRALFVNNTARMQYLTSLMMGTKNILETGKGLNHHDNYHEFCRLLGRFKVHYQLAELVGVECYNAWIGLVADFTLMSLQSWKWASSSIYYLLNLWSKMVTSLPYLKGDIPASVQLEDFVPKILEVFISSRLDMQSATSDDSSEDPMDKIELMQDQLDFFPYLCRFQYGSCSSYIMNVMDPILQAFMEGAKLQDHVVPSNLALLETKLAWLVHIVASIVKVKQYSGGETNEIIDADLSARVLQMINVMDTGPYIQRYGELSRQRLELAVINFFQCFRKTYIGDQAFHSSKIYVRLSELLGLHDHMLIAEVMVRKIAMNLRCCSESEDVLDQTMSFFLEMASGFMTAKLLLKLETIQYMIVNHSKDHFRFLEDYGSRRRTRFYYIIGSLVFMEDSLLKFKQSMDPFVRVLVNLESIPHEMFRNETVKSALIGILRDLRGITMATNSRRTYGFLFDWIYPAHMPLLLSTVAHFADSPEVTTPLLKFVAELVLNKTQRLAFDQSSPNGILLFREVSKLLVAYGSRMLTLPCQHDVYTTKYKGIMLSLVILSRAIAGNYVNFGVFELYGDSALDDALDIALKMILSIPANHILVYRKVTGAYFSFVEVIFSRHIKFALKLDASNFKYLITSLHSGLKLLDSNITSQCASAIDHLATFYVEQIVNAESVSSLALLNFAKHVSDCAGIFLDMLISLFEIALFEDTSNRWSISRPMLSLILLNEEMYAKLKAQILASQPIDQQQRLCKCFDTLMEDVTQSLESKNREKFTQNVNRFRKEFREK